MNSSKLRIAVTAAGGKLGRLAVSELRKRIPETQILATVRREEVAAEFRSMGVAAQIANYDEPESLDRAFEGVNRILIISSNASGRRVKQHSNAIDAAKRAGVEFVAYTSVLHADQSAMALAAEHLDTEKYLKASGLSYALLRNGWYTENYTAMAKVAVARGVLLGSAGLGLIASAPRIDFAEAAANVLTSPALNSGDIYEFAGDHPYTLHELAAEISRQSNREVEYKDLPPSDYEEELIKMGIPARMAATLADCDLAASKGALNDGSLRLSSVLGRPTTPLADVVALALKS